MFKIGLATTLFLFAGVLASSAEPKPKHRQNQNVSRKSVAVPEPSVLLLASLGMGSVLAGSWYVRRRR